MPDGNNWWDSIDDDSALKLKEKEALAALKLKSNSPVPSRISAPNKDYSANGDKSFSSEFFNIPGAIEDIKGVGSAVADTAKRFSDAYNDPSISQLGPTGRLPIAAQKTFLDPAVKNTVEDPIGTAKGLGKVAFQTAAFAAFPPLSPLLVPLAGTGYEVVADKAAGYDDSTPAELGTKLRREFLFNSLLPLAAKTAPGLSKYAEAKIREWGYKVKKKITGVGEKAVDEATKLSKPGSTVTSLGSVDKTASQVGTSQEKLAAEKTLVNERVVHDVDMSPGRDPVDIASDLGKNIQDRLAKYQTVEDALLKATDATGATIEASSFIDAPTVKTLTTLIPNSEQVFPRLTELSKRVKNVPGNTLPLSVTDANGLLKEIQDILAYAGEYDNVAVKASAAEKANAKFLLEKLRPAATQLAKNIDSTISASVNLPDIAKSLDGVDPRFVKSFEELNAAQHDLLYFVDDFPAEGVGKVIAKRQGALNPERLGPESTAVTAPRLTAGRTASTSVGDIAKLVFTSDEALAKALQERGITEKMFRDAQQAALLASGDATIPPSIVLGIKARAKDILSVARQEAGKLGVQLSGLEELDRVVSEEPKEEGLGPRAAANLLSAINPLSPASAEAQPQPAPTPISSEVASGLGAGFDAQALIQSKVPRDPDIIARDPRLQAQLFSKLQQNTALLVMDALASKDPLKRRLAFSQAFIEAPDAFEESVTGARSEIRVGDGFVLGDPSEIPIITAKLTARFRHGEIKSVALAKQLSALNDPADQRLFPEPNYPSLEDELRGTAKRVAPKTPQEALERNSPRRIKTVAGERRVYEDDDLEGASSKLGKP